MPESEYKRTIPELLAPAGNFEKLACAVHYGADAVYCGGKQFSLRAQAGNFSETEMVAAVKYCHAQSVKLYVTANIFARKEDFTTLPDYLLWLRDIGVDGLIVSDPGILRLARKLVPGLPLHLSTQANVTNGNSALFWLEQGVSRLNLARELSLAEISRLRQELTTAGTRAQLEIFVHGALCISYSGRCLLSLYMTGRDANRGRCAHPCRYRYVLEEEKRPGQYFPVEEDDRGTYIFNARDLCLLNRLPDLLASGVDSLKIEGRMKSVYYVGAVTRVYRAALDWIANTMQHCGSNGMPELPGYFMAELSKAGTRGYTENFADGAPDAGAMLYGTPREHQAHVPAGIVRGQVSGEPEIELRNPLEIGERLEYLGPGLESQAVTVLAIKSPAGEVFGKGNPGMTVLLQTEPAAQAWQPHSLLRKIP